MKIAKWLVILLSAFICLMWISAYPLPITTPIDCWSASTWLIFPLKSFLPFLWFALAGGYILSLAYLGFVAFHQRWQVNWTDLLPLILSTATLLLVVARLLTLRQSSQQFEQNRSQYDHVIQLLEAQTIPLSDTPGYYENSYYDYYHINSHTAALPTEQRSLSDNGIISVIAAPEILRVYFRVTQCADIGIGNDPSQIAYVYAANDSPPPPYYFYTQAHFEYYQWYCERVDKNWFRCVAIWEGALL